MALWLSKAGLTQNAEEFQALISLHRLPGADGQSLQGAVLFLVGLFPRPPSNLLGPCPPPGLGKAWVKPGSLSRLFPICPEGKAQSLMLPGLPF